MCVCEGGVCMSFSHPNPLIRRARAESSLPASWFPVFIPVSSLQNPAIADIYTEHAHQVVVAKYAPSGFYIASGGTCLSSRMAPWSMWCAPPPPPQSWGQAGRLAWEGGGWRRQGGRGKTLKERGDGRWGERDEFQLGLTRKV